MKKRMLFVFFACGLLFHAEAQTKTLKKKTPAKKTATAKSSPAKRQDTTVVSLASADNHTAKGTQTSVTNFRIADPTIQLFNLRAVGLNPKPSVSPIIGMPESTYGIANGKILLRNTTATTPGTAYGSGAVGTGTSIAGAGTSEATVGVNGKNPYASTWLWGDKRILTKQVISDSTGRKERRR